MRQPVLGSSRTQPREILTSAFVRMSEQAPFYLFITFVLTYGADHLELTKDDLLNYTSGRRRHRPGQRAAVRLPVRPHRPAPDVRDRHRLTALFAFPYFGLLNTRTAGLVMLAIVVSLIFHDMQYGPQAALIAERFGDQRCGTRGAGLGYQLASVIAGGPAPLIAAGSWSTGSSTWISWYIVGCCVVS